MLVLQTLFGLGRIPVRMQVHHVRCVWVELGMQAAYLLVSGQFGHGFVRAVYPLSEGATIIQAIASGSRGSALLPARNAAKRCSHMA
jgi:hypothetical protein